MVGGHPPIVLVTGQEHRREMNGLGPATFHQTGVHVVQVYHEADVLPVEFYVAFVKLACAELHLRPLWHESAEHVRVDHLVTTALVLLLVSLVNEHIPLCPELRESGTGSVELFLVEEQR